MTNYFTIIKRLTFSLKLIDITTFFHLRINRESQYFILSNNRNITDHLIQNSDIGILLNELVKTSICGKISVVFWKRNLNDCFLEKIFKLGIWNGISVALPFKNHIDIFSFASSIDDTKLHGFYLNYFELIKRFIIFFRLKAKKSIEYASQNLYQLSKKIEFYCHSNKKDKIALLKTIRQQSRPKKASIKTVYLKKIFLTEKETIYLNMLLEGKSMRAISEELHVSQRSVKYCLETIKCKTGYNTKIELLIAFLENQTYLPSIHYE